MDSLAIKYFECLHFHFLQLSLTLKLSTPHLHVSFLPTAYYTTVAWHEELQFSRKFCPAPGAMRCAGQSWAGLHVWLATFTHTTLWKYAFHSRYAELILVYSIIINVRYNCQIGCKKLTPWFITLQQYNCSSLQNGISFPISFGTHHHAITPYPQL